ncbi:2-hydroxyacid dehydrogenase [Hymenobacter rubripertinctus]|uniref:2-hydroxyacid dehydrogenase n=1 Tax=Hymenobacter rubripertinctus TaxID=2029981 RepID=A0A418QJP4_9BACT|nr:2-hydroxyacid dehydrogenase [Hymenobacter rubripertinctus]RIY05436.1 2-hydroxyacid dehydrogenase [Hymenobacter rubripertinctus]
MNVTIFSTLAFERPFLEQANAGRHELRFLETSLNDATVALARGSEAVCVFSPDNLSAPVLEQLHGCGVRSVAVRAAGTDNVDLPAAHRLGLRVANVPDYSPYAIAEHAVLLMLALCRHLRQANQQLRTNDFRLDDLMGFDLHGKTVGIVGVGRIGEVLARILHGFGCRLLGTDIQPNPDLTAQYGLRYVPLPELCAQADIVSLHTPLNAQTQHLLNDQVLGQMKRGVLLVNTGRGGVLDTEAALRALNSGQLGYLGLDVYEHEKGLFFGDHSTDKVRDPLYAKLLTYPNVLLTGHQAYLTREALTNIADAVVASLDAWGQGQPAPHQL